MPKLRAGRRLSTRFNLKNVFFKHRLVYVLGFTTVLIFILGPTAAHFESQNNQSNIRTYIDGIWWAAATVTTVSYGDYYPVTALGRINGLIFMTVGLSSFSLVTANIAALIVEQDEESQLVAIRNQLYETNTKLDKLLNQEK